jgi:CRISPR-associated protein Csd2
VTDVCLKRKIRDRLQTAGLPIFVQSDEKKTDGMPSLKHRAEAEAPIGLGKNAFKPSAENTKDKIAKRACEQWLDVRSFGQVFAFGKEADAAGVSIAIRGPVTIQSAFSVEPVSITSTQITKSVNGEGDGAKKGSDTMGMKHRVDSAIYVVYGAMTPQLAEKTKFSDEDAESIKAILPKLFEGDESSARPAGSMAVKKVIWWQHNSKAGQYSSANVHDLLLKLIDSWKEDNNEDKNLLNQIDNLKPDSESSKKLEIGNLKPEIIDGF